MHEDLEEAKKTLGIELPNLDSASKLSQEEIGRIEFGLNKFGSDIKKQGIDLILLGSMGRKELTSSSDFDYFVLQNGCSPDASQNLLVAAEKTREALNLPSPGRQGVFGDIVIGANLYEQIGLESDSNKNLTHRILFLTESHSVFSTDDHDLVFNHILDRYVADNSRFSESLEDKSKIPRYLLNDLIRFWRTMAVDFGAKRWRSVEDDSHLRLIKLKISRKILFAGPLCTLLLVPERTKTVGDLKQHLSDWLRKPPLVQLASVAIDKKFNVSESSNLAIKKILKNYDAFLGALGNPEVRHALKKPNEKNHSTQINNMAEDIQKNLEYLFFDEPVFNKNFRKYSVF